MKVSMRQMSKWAPLLLLVPVGASAALISRVYTFSDGNVLFADQLNTELNNLVNGVNSINNDNLATNANISASKISAAIAGSGLTRNGTTGVLSVVPDNSTIEISANALQVKDAGITAAKLAPDVKGASLPSGSILTFAGPTCPSGYVLANGAAVSRTVTYADLFAAIGTAHGSGDGSTTFNLPDYRGRFLRGVDGGAAKDPNASTRLSMATGGATGDNVGSVQGHSFQTHSHAVNDPGHRHTENILSIVGFGGLLVQETPGTYRINNAGSPSSLNTTGITLSNSSGAGPTSQLTADETRPINAYVNYCVKL